MEVAGACSQCLLVYLWLVTHEIDRRVCPRFNIQLRGLPQPSLPSSQPLAMGSGKDPCLQGVLMGLRWCPAWKRELSFVTRRINRRLGAEVGQQVRDGGGRQMQIRVRGPELERPGSRRVCGRDSPPPAGPTSTPLLLFSVFSSHPRPSPSLPCSRLPSTAIVQGSRGAVFRACGPPGASGNFSIQHFLWERLGGGALETGLQCPRS